LLLPVSSPRKFKNDKTKFYLRIRTTTKIFVLNWLKSSARVVFETLIYVVCCFRLSASGFMFDFQVFIPVFVTAINYFLLHDKMATGLDGLLFTLTTTLIVARILAFPTQIDLPDN
jgi:hypothetical protein